MTKELSLKEAIGAVVFDMDGCLVDSEPISLQSIITELKALGVDEFDVQDATEQFLGVGMNDIYWSLKRQLRSEIPSDFIDRVEARTIEAYHRELNQMPGLDELLNELEQLGYRLGIATGASSARVRATLQIAGLEKVFLGTVANVDEVASGKPSPDVFELAARKIGIEPRNCLAVEDSPHGVKAACAAGMTAIGFVGGSHLIDRRDKHRKLLLDAGAIAVVETLKELADKIREVTIDDKVTRQVLNQDSKQGG